MPALDKTTVHKKRETIPEVEIKEEKQKLPKVPSSSSSSSAPKPSKAVRLPPSEPPRAPYIESVRNRAERETLPGHMCTECRRYYEALAQQGMLFDEDARREMLLQCSRHKARWSPPHTPQGFWDLEIPTPDEWR